uniref:Reverse transcriptase/retrotransposon-derived protein RNase H-like domain-containing protein n=1 Tax=Fagus sylvatica TaxID=28930 RepID=A0A2N9F7Y1_FAGSY
MVQETKTGVPIGVLSDNVQEIQQPVDDQANAIREIGARLERMETSFASFQALLEERLPPRQSEPVQTPPQAMQGAKTRNAMPMRPPTQEIRAQPNQPRELGMKCLARPPRKFGGQFEPQVDDPWLGRGIPRQKGQVHQHGQQAPPHEIQINLKRLEMLNGAKMVMKMQKPRTLGEAYALTKIQEEYLATVKRSARPSYEANMNNWGQPSSQQAATIRHKCKSMKLYLIEEVSECEVDCEIEKNEEEYVELGDEGAEITLCAPLGSTSPSTMRLIAIINGQKVVVLIDTGSTHNFMDKGLATSLKLQVDNNSCFGVKVANGQIIKTMGECKAIKFNIQDLKLEVNFNLLELGGYGIVLGTQWLSTLGVISSKKFEDGVAKGLLLQIMPCELAIIQEPIESPMQELEGVPPHCQRPYRYPYFQKTEIEKIVKDLIDFGSVRPSQSLFASPVLLMWKADVMDELLDELQGARVFLKLDLRPGYHQIGMKEEDIEKTTFKTHEGHYEYLLMPCGLTNAPATFQSLMNEGMEEHEAHLKIVLKTLAKHQLYAKMSKCVFAASEVEYLGHVILAKGAEQAFEKHKETVSHPPVLALPNFTQNFVVECDASGVGIEAVLMQRGRPLAFFSQASKGKNLFLSTYEKELLALVLAQKWISKLLGYNIVVEYKQGKENKVAYALSRNEETNLKIEIEGETTLLQAQAQGSLCAISFPSLTWLEELKASYEEDDTMKDLLGRLQDGEASEGHNTVKNGLLLYKGRFHLGNSSSMKSKVLALIHDNPLGRHSGYFKTLLRGKRECHWQGMKSDVKSYIKGCDICQRIKHETNNKVNEQYLRAFAAMGRMASLGKKTMHKKLGKLGRKFYGPFKVLGKIRAVSYKLELLEDAKIHHVFHVSCLKAKVGQFITPLYKMPPVDSLGHLAPEPTKILETRVVKKRRLPTVTEVLVFWEGATKEDAT